MINDYQILQGNALAVLKTLESESVQCCISSPPYYGLRNYSVEGQIGLEQSPAEYIAKLVEIFEEVRRILKKDGTLFLNLGSSYAGSWGNYRGRNRGNGTQRNIISGSSVTDQADRNGSYLPPTANVKGFKPKDLIPIPWMVAMALQQQGWWLRSDLPWVKRSALPESCTDRPSRALEYVFLLTKNAKYFFDMNSVRVKQAESQNGRVRDDKIGGNKGDLVHHSPGGRYVTGRDRSLPQNRNGITGSLDETPAGSRNFRNSDLWFSSLKEPHGLVGIGDELVGLDVNPSGFAGEFCANCKSYFDGADKKRIKVVETESEDGEKETIRYCTCGRGDAWLSHFATFPQRLIEPLILAGTSEKGQCAGCGKAYTRLSNTELVPTVKASFNSTVDSRDIAADVNDQGSNRMKDGHKPGWINSVSTVGWQKPCKCDTDEIEPQTVLDPFAGAGTTILVSLKFKRKCVGVELNEDYIAMSKHRLKSLQVELF